MKAVRYFGHKDVRVVNDLEKPVPKGDEVFHILFLLYFK